MINTREAISQLISEMYAESTLTSDIGKQNMIDSVTETLGIKVDSESEEGLSNEQRLNVLWALLD